MLLMVPKVQAKSLLVSPPGVILVEATVDGLPATLLVDTGTERSCLDIAFASRLHVILARMEPVQLPYATGLSGSVHIGSLQIASAAVRDVSVSTSDLSALSRGAGVTIDGILGVDILRRSTVRLDFSSGSVEFGNDELIPKDGVSVGLEPTDDLYFVPVNVEGHTTNLLLDTGTNTSSISSDAWSAIVAHWTPSETIDGIRSTGGAQAAKLVCIPTIGLGEARSLDVAIRVQPRTPSGLFSSGRFEGLLGTDVLRQFIVTLDFINARMYLKNNPKSRTDPYLFSTIGIQFAKDEGGNFTIMAVWNPSPAASAGLRVGDTILAVNQQESHQISLDDLSRQIHGRPGMKVNLTVVSDGRRYNIGIPTRDLLCPAQTSNH